MTNDPFTPQTAHPDEIMEVVVVESGFTADELKGQSRERPLVGWRQVAMAAARETSGWSFPALGRYFGGRDHTTVIHACQRVAAIPSASACKAKVVNLAAHAQGELAL